MSDQLTAAAQAMQVPQAIVERSARAWAAASGASFDDVISSWAGDGPVVSAAAPTSAEASSAPTEDAEATTETVTETAPASAPAAPAVPSQPAPVYAQAAPVVDEPDVEPLVLGERLRIAGRIGAWTGATLGFLGFVMASTWMLSAASVAGEEGAFSPAVEVTTSRFVLGVALMSIVFGIVVAAFSRTATGWVSPGGRLEGKAASTVVWGGVLGLVLGLGAGAVMVSAFSEPLEGVEGMASMRLVPSAIVVLIGGAVMGWLTALVIQLMGVPAGVDESQSAEISEVRGRLAAAVRIPVAAALLLGILVLPLGITFIRSNELASGGASLLAIVAAGAILGIAAISASRPTMSITFGEFLVAVAGIGTVVLIIFAVLHARSEPEPAEHDTEHTAEEVTDTTEAPSAALRVTFSV